MNYDVISADSLKKRQVSGNRIRNKTERIMQSNVSEKNEKLKETSKFTPRKDRDNIIYQNLSDNGENDGEKSERIQSKNNDMSPQKSQEQHSIKSHTLKNKLKKKKDPDFDKESEKVA